MESSGVQASSGGRGRHLLFYDGLCGLCDWLVPFVLRRDRCGVFDFAPLQGAAARARGLDPADLTTMYVFEDYRTEHAHVLARGRAWLFVLRQLGGPWPQVAAVLGLLPGVCLDWGYELVARNRYRLFGRRAACAVPPPADRGRFLD